MRWSAGQAEADHVDLEQRLADEVVEPLPQQGARPVQPGGVDEDQLRGVGGRDPADGVPGGLRLARGDGDLVPHERVGQRGLAGIGPSDEAGEACPELGAHDASSRWWGWAGSAAGVSGPVLPLGVVLLVQALHDDGGDAVTAPGHPLGGEQQPGHLALASPGSGPARWSCRAGRRRCRPPPPRSSRRRARPGRRRAWWRARGSCRRPAARPRAAPGRTRRRSRRRSPRGCPRW